MDKASERVDVALHWVGGAVQPHTLARPVGRYAQQSHYARLVERVRVMCAARLSSARIAERLKAEGFRPPKWAARFRGEMVRCLAAGLGLAHRTRDGNTAGLGPDECRPAALARRLLIGRDTVRSWIAPGGCTSAGTTSGTASSGPTRGNCAGCVNSMASRGRGPTRPAWRN